MLPLSHKINQSDFSYVLIININNINYKLTTYWYTGPYFPQTNVCFHKNGIDDATYFAPMPSRSQRSRVRNHVYN